MCFHNSMTKKATELAARYNRKNNFTAETEIQINNMYHISAFTFPTCAVISGKTEMQAYQWGLIPSWIKNSEDAENIRRKTLNARAETIFEKPSFRHAIKVKRCLVPSTGFFDWRHENDKKIPYFITIKDDEIFSMAGIYEVWHYPESDKTLHTFSIITTEANEMMRHIDNTNFRMPVIIPRDKEEQWLNPDLTTPDVERLLKPYDNSRMDAHVVNHDFLRMNPHDKTIISPAP